MAKGTLHCAHTGMDDLDPGLLWILMSLERELGYEIRINNGARCPACNKNVGGADKSAHLIVPGRKCKAFDVNQSGNPQIETLRQYLTGAGNSLSRFQLLKTSLTSDPDLHLIIISKLLEKGVNRFGIGRNFFHFDIARQTEGNPENVCWLYS